VIASVDPRTGETRERFHAHDGAEIERRLARAAAAFETHRRSTFAERAAGLVRAAEILESEKRAYGRMMTEEMGKPLAAAVQEAEKCAAACRYYAAHGERFLAAEPVALDDADAHVSHEPIGAVLAVMPWNFPFWQVIRFAAPALMAGNVALLKHAANVPRCALALEDLFARAGFGDGVFQTLLVESDAVAAIIEDRRVAAVTLTGSNRAGSAVASTAGRVIKKTVLELGGSDAFVVMPSADLAEAARTAVRARTINNGQSCIAAKRFIVAAEVYDEFVERFVGEMASLRVGDPLDEATDIGPLATLDQAETVARQVTATVAAGARLLLGGRRPEGPGFYYPPTVLADIPDGSPGATEEVFGPVALVHRARDAADAARLANASQFGLGASIWTGDAAERDLLVREIQAGMVFVNGMVASDPRIPFGGVKQSGYGRELGRHGILEFVNVKSVVVRSRQA
jgi:succinate-semialdehyde dehydrogenase/glutarate-semialdehyde dehydrogenase